MSSILQSLNQCKDLAKQKEDEVTWSKIDTVFTLLKNELSLEEDCERFINQSMDLLLRSILSERSKLSGTSLNFLKKIFEILKNRVGNISNILSTLLKLSGRSNKIVYTRAHDTLISISQYIDLSQHIKLLTEFFDSSNKNIRLGVIKLVINNQHDNLKIQKLVDKGKSDTYIEIRNLCKNENKPKEIVEHKKLEKSFSIILEKSEIQHSPFKKIPKIERNTESIACNKISELEEQVKTITNYKKIDKKSKPVIFKPQKFIKEKKEIQDDLTPKKLDKYLSKYRNIYGNILEEKQDVKEEDQEVCDLSREIENISLVEESRIESLTYEYTIMNSDKTKIEIKDEQIEVNLEDKEFNDNKDLIKENLKDQIINDEEKVSDTNEDKIKKDNEDKIKNDNQNEVLENHYDFTNKNKVDKTEQDNNENTEEILVHDKIDVVNQVDKNTQLNTEILNQDLDSTDSIIATEKENNEVKEVKKPCSLDSQNSSFISKVKDNSQNRFSSLLFADKEECVIADINAESPLFKKTEINSIGKFCKDQSNMKSLDDQNIPDDTDKHNLNDLINNNNNAENFNNNTIGTSPKSVINTAVSSSFLYANDKSELDISVDYTKIDSVIYVDKNLFMNKKK